MFANRIQLGNVGTGPTQESSDRLFVGERDAVNRSGQQGTAAPGDQCDTEISIGRVFDELQNLVCAGDAFFGRLVDPRGSGRVNVDAT